MSAYIKNQFGTVNIEDQVIATIASEAAMKCYGVVGLVNATTSENIMNLLGKESLSQGIVLKIEDNNLNIDVSVILEFGVKIAVVSDNIIETIKFQVERETGIKVNKINVIVRDIRLQDQGGKNVNNRW
ncbi:MAG: Asp23/Gls24 family envelope stress response protein [Lagierella massiliensis]|nr:Asp23/Gls24 family envelope stress response protein [Lagierella massiliensis]